MCVFSLCVWITKCVKWEGKLELGGGNKKVKAYFWKRVNRKFITSKDKS